MFSPDGTLISASAAPHCGGLLKKESFELGFEVREGGDIPQAGRQRIPDRWGNETERTVANWQATNSRQLGQWNWKNGRQLSDKTDGKKKEQFVSSARAN